MQVERKEKGIIEKTNKRRRNGEKKRKRKGRIFHE